VEEVQMHHAVGMLLHGVVELAVYLQRDAELLAALAGDAFFRRFARLDLAAGELPEQAAVFLSGPLADQELAPLPDHRCRHFHHRLLRHTFAGGYTLPKFISLLNQYITRGGLSQPFCRKLPKATGCPAALRYQSSSSSIVSSSSSSSIQPRFGSGALSFCFF